MMLMNKGTPRPLYPVAAGGTPVLSPGAPASVAKASSPTPTTASTPRANTLPCTIRRTPPIRWGLLLTLLHTADE